MTGSARGWRPSRLAAIALALLASSALLADVIAADAPVWVRRGGATYLLPAITRPALFAGKSADDISSQLAPEDAALWPLVRSGPRTATRLAPFSGASLAHPLGTDAFARDVLAGLVHGSRTSLTMAAIVTALATILGAVIGSAAAVLGGMWDALAERVVEVVCVFPVVVVVALVRALDRRASVASFVLVLIAVQGATIVRLTRVLVLRALATDWALSARAAGASPLRILRVDVAPHLVGPLAQAAVIGAASVVLTETAVAFLELGAPSDAPSWGDLLAQVRWGAGLRVVLPPIVSLGLTVGALQIVADAGGRARQRPSP